MSIQTKLHLALAALAVAIITIGVLVLQPEPSTPTTSSAPTAPAPETQPAPGAPPKAPTARAPVVPSPQAPSAAPDARIAAQPVPRAGAPAAAPKLATPEQQAAPARPISTQWPMAGEAATASVTVDGKAIDLGEPNQAGIYRRVRTEPGTAVPVEVAYPGGAAGTEVVVAVQHGGSLRGGAPAEVMKLDELRRARFTYTVGGEPGLFHVTVRKGSDVKILDFWAGPEPALAGQ